jgi:hypothetical protein
MDRGFFGVAEMKLRLCNEFLRPEHENQGTTRMVEEHASHFDSCDSWFKIWLVAT